MAKGKVSGIAVRYFGCQKQGLEYVLCAMREPGSRRGNHVHQVRRANRRNCSVSWRDRKEQGCVRPARHLSRWPWHTQLLCQLRRQGDAQLLLTVLTGWLIFPLIAIWIWVIVEVCTVNRDAQGVPFS